MDEIIVLRLPKNFAGQLLECLEVTVEDWHRTKIYHEDGNIDPDEPYVRECSNADEAGKIETFYKEIKADIERQIDEQSQLNI